jgi:FAD/FMN-containing dehydrogenase
MTAQTVTNWFGDLVSHPKVVVDAHSVQDILKVMMNPAQYPAPVRAVGSNHSTAPCGTAEGGTLIRIRMNRILRLDDESITVEAGAVHIDMAEELLKRGKQFYVNTEIGSLSAGSAACAGTKDSSFPGEYGQVGSYITRIKMVLPSGELLEVSDNAQPELMQKVRSSYGLFGVVYEVTYRIRALLPMAVHHKTFHIQEFVDQLPQLQALGYAMMYYIFPFEDLITVEFRRYNPRATGEANRSAWKLRNYLWGTAGPRFAADAERNIADPTVRYAMIDSFNAIWRFKLENIVKSDHTIPSDQIIRYPEQSDESRYTFSLFAFPEETFLQALPQFCQLCLDYYKAHGYRSNLLCVGYAIGKDQQSLLSYSNDANVFTIDPVSTANPGWREFLAAFNQFGSKHGGLPLLNQTFGVTPAIAAKAFGQRLRVMEKLRREFDPNNRLLNNYFEGLLTADELSGAAGAI